ncbi:MAG: hypothetical protein CMG74_00450 [Candidatus Marinimicrobia bacterium]|nr:hypothetical protein [Candidatus Neomarinimicrobiota bacterium]|tara:strand:- start:14430 stop:15104 length:675 start_codon:yes stop_codon:yes gene_type:complete
MSHDIKSGIGYLIPAAGVIGFFVSLIMGESILSIIVAVGGILVWFTYMMIMESPLPEPSQLGNLIIFFGVLLTLGIFMAFGVTQNMFGGFEFQTEGSLVSLIILFFSILTGMLFRNQIIGNATTSELNAGLTDADRKWVKKALEENLDSDNKKDEPKVIVVKQETPDKEIIQDKKEKDTQSSPPNWSYGSTNNPYYAYPPHGYYYGDEYEDEYGDEYEDGWEEE